MEKIKKLKQHFKKELIDGYLIPKNDQFFGEYVSKNNEILIDGAHTRSYVMSDSKKAFSMLKNGGVILWHDYKPEAPDVFSYLNDLSSEMPLRHISGTDFVIFQRAS